MLENGKFEDFCKEWGIKHVSSSPYMPRSNGIPEECVKEMKKIIMAKISSAGVLDKSSALTGLQMFRNMPWSPTDLSPAQFIFGIQILGLQEVRHIGGEKQSKKVQRELPLLHPGQIVRIQDPKSKHWIKCGTIINFGKNHPEYLVWIDQAVYRKNRMYQRPKDVESDHQYPRSSSWLKHPP